MTPPSVPSPDPATTTPDVVTPRPAPARVAEPPATTDRSSFSPVSSTSACADARHWTVAQLERLGVGTPDARDDAEVIVSELVTNALQHGSPPVVVTLTATEDGVFVAVADAGGPPYLFGSLSPDPAAVHGRGLAIVSTLAAAWGVRVRQPGPGKTVWGQLRGTGP